jgi:hypothetical protein
MPAAAEAISVDASEAYDLLRKYAIRFDKATEDENGLDLKVDFNALWNLAHSYTDDIKRYQSYHHAPIPARARRAAYLCKWIMKFRPLIVMNPIAVVEEEVQTFLLMANETFALWCASGEMEFDWSNISDELRVVLLYSLRHRYNSEDTYILFFAKLCNF